MPTCSNAMRRLRLSGLLLSLVPALGHGANGLKPIGIGAESAAMGGADLALAHDSTALHSNPAGLAFISGGVVDAYTGGVYPLNIRHRDELGNDVEMKGVSPSLGYLGLARRLQNEPVSIGLGFLKQGAEASFSNVRTVYGTQDDLSSRLESSSISGGVAYHINDHWSVGAAVTTMHVAASQEVLPNTSTTSFFGFRMDDVTASGTGFRFGLLYQPSPTLRWGLAYSNRVDLQLSGNRLTSNQTAVGLGNVTYRDVRLTGLRQPREIGSGVAVQLSERLLGAFELNWIEWSKAIDRSTLTVSDPDNPAAPSTVSVTTANNWRDQYVYALGFAYTLDPKTMLRFGYNYGRNPVPPETLSPLLAPIGEQHVMFGLGRDLSDRWRLEGGIEYLLNKRVRYTNPDSPFGPNSVAESEAFALHLSLMHRW